MRLRGETLVLPCSCKHAQQDAMYGKGQRVHNVSKGSINARGQVRGNGVRCTVCGTERHDVV